MANEIFHDIGSIVVSGSGGFNLDGVRDLNPDPATQQIIENAGGQVDPTFAATIQTVPMISGTVTDIATFLGGIGISGLAFPQTTVITTVEAFFTKIAKGGTRTSGSTHFKLECNEGIIVPGTLSWSQGQAATLSMQVLPTWDGTNAPFIYEDSVALPHVPSIGEMFTGGKVMINGTELDGVQGVSIDFGLTVERQNSGGNLYPEFAGITVRRPKIEIKAKNVPAWNTFGLNGTAQGSTDSVIYLQKLEKNNNILAAATAEHISITIDDGMIVTGSGGGSNNTTSEITITILPTWDGTAAILAINTATAIS